MDGGASISKGFFNSSLAASTASLYSSLASSSSLLADGSSLGKINNVLKCPTVVFIPSAEASAGENTNSEPSCPAIKTNHFIFSPGLLMVRVELDKNSRPSGSIISPLSLAPGRVLISISVSGVIVISSSESRASLGIVRVHSMPEESSILMLFSLPSARNSVDAALVLSTLNVALPKLLLESSMGSPGVSTIATSILS